MTDVAIERLRDTLRFYRDGFHIEPPGITVDGIEMDVSARAKPSLNDDHGAMAADAMTSLASVSAEITLLQASLASLVARHRWPAWLPGRRWPAWLPGRRWRARRPMREL